MYEEFAAIYDRLTTDVDYKGLADYYEAIFKKFNIAPELILDLGCGTGSLTAELEKRGYDMIGADNSAEMLMEAQKKTNALLLLQSMTAFELYGTVGAIISSLDSVNYLTDSHDVEKMLALVKNYLDPGGLFIFDINTQYKLKHVLGENTYVVNDEDVFYSWESEYHEDTKLCDFYLTFFVRKGKNSFHRIDELQTERAYSVKELLFLIKKTGLSVEGVFANRSFSRPQEKEERVFFVVRKK